jgi:hypothetical protein
MVLIFVTTKQGACSLSYKSSGIAGNKIKPDFFKRRSKLKEKKPVRQKLLTMWDFQNMPVSADDVSDIDRWLRDMMGRRFPSTIRRRFKAFSHTSQTSATDILLELGWKVFEDDCDMDKDLIDQSRSECLQSPENITLIIITKDRDYLDLIEELKLKRVRVYVISPTDGSQDLIEAVGKKRWIPWQGSPKTGVMASINNNKRELSWNQPSLSRVSLGRAPLQSFNCNDYDDDD